MHNELTGQVLHVYRFALRLTAANVHTAEDIVQETMLRAVRGQESLKDPAKLRVWLFGIAANVWKDTLRKDIRRREVDGGRSYEAAVCGALPVPEQALMNEQIELSLAALDKLPDRQRSVLYLRACQEMSIADIADILEISSQAAKSSLNLARVKMRHMMQVDSTVDAGAGGRTDVP